MLAQNSFIPDNLQMALSISRKFIFIAGFVPAAAVLLFGYSLGSSKPDDHGAEDEKLTPLVEAAASQPVRLAKGHTIKVGYLTSTHMKPTRCFSDYFTLRFQRALKLSERPQWVKLPLQGDLRGYDLLILSGEGAFELNEGERKALRDYLGRGGFLLAAAGFGSADWDKAFRVEVSRLFNGQNLKALPGNHPLLAAPFLVTGVSTRKGKPAVLEGVNVNGRLTLFYASSGLNDSAHVKDCCLCDGNEVQNSWAVCANVLGWVVQERL